jgi:hypothetical protein
MRKKAIVEIEIDGKVQYIDVDITGITILSAMIKIGFMLQEMKVVKLLNITFCEESI